MLSRSSLRLLSLTGRTSATAAAPAFARAASISTIAKAGNPLASRNLAHAFVRPTAKQTIIRTSQRSYSVQTKPTPRDEGPKFRYIVLLVILGTAGFVWAEKNVRKKKPRDFNEEDYEAIKKRARIMHKKTAFTPEEALVIFVLGGPGSGKGTQCANLVRDYNFVHLSAGDLLRAEQAREGSQYGELISNYIKEGKIVPQEVTIALLRNAMRDAIIKRLDEDPDAAIEEGPVRFLIDGFPRKMDQALIFEDDVCISRFTLFFECPEEVMLKRLLKRGETSGRTDDNVESIKKRFHTFVDTSMPVIEYFDKSGKVFRIPCDQPVENVYSQVKGVLQDRLGI
ncbi:uncharacterized protein SAPINGB_P003397 [Magnusiomyces paraingens]|uniref:Uridylate kinase n=1 Tax=Magnusiomyces paraingens TaxID=2606893 RepID=A0A5E8BUL4_9ASCO|nr:uncharacterized protein SAPINGB_P003397 [Saprochaete ingens]VVT53087.1 unnamed protein product [Saprochaete ingens]